MLWKSISVLFLTMWLLTNQDQDRRFDPRDLRLKLQKKHHGLQRGRGASFGMQDLREKLSGTVNPPKFKREAARPAVKKFVGETKSETRTASNKATKKKSQQVL